MSDKVLVRLGHGYYRGGVTPLPNVCPTIDAHVDCWHILIGEKMEDIKCRVVGNLKDKRYNEMTSRVYSPSGLAPTQQTCCGGNHETKIIVERNRFFEQAFETAQENDCDYGDTIDAFNKKVNKSGVSPTVTTRPEGFKTAILAIGEPLAVDEQNGYVRQDGTVGTLTTDGSSPKHNNRVIYVQRQMADSTEEPCGCNIRQGGEDYYRVPLENVSRALRTFDNAGVSTKHYIRKLTPKECGRLMGVRDDDIDKMSVNQSNSALYHCFGDSIVVDVLMAIFKQML